MTEYKAACDGARKDLLNCLLQSECYKVEGLTPRECLMRNHEMPEECKPIRIRLYQCKRSQIDARTRFRGKRDDV